MIDCRLCWHRSLPALFTSQSARSSTVLSGPRLTAPRLRGLLSTCTPRTSAAQPEAVTEDGRHIRPGSITLQDRLAFRQSHALQKSQLPTSLSMSSPPESSKSPKASPVLQSSPPPRLTFSEDPAKLAAQTKCLLAVAASNPSPEARLVPLTYVRAATSAGKTDPTAAWNELISYAMQTGDSAGAYKHYNDMKKRGVSPNSHTYTILISGLALPHNAKHTTFLPRALATYRALRDRERDSKGGRGKAEWNLIHTNAILKVCSRAGALEEMWQIVGELPEEGKNSADAKTYTSLINGLRQMRGPGGRPNRSKAEPELKDERWDPRRLDIAECQRIEEIVDDAERMWGGLLTRYKNGKLAIDEELICAMARMRLSSTRSRDWYKVFSMMEELYGIPNFHAADGKVPSIGTGRARWSPPGAPKAETATLAILLETAEHVQASPALLKAYWEYFTQTLTVKPDLENHHGYLRALRRSREGQAAADLVELMVQNAIKALDKPSNTKAPSSGRRKPGDWDRTKKFAFPSASEAYTSFPPIPIQKTFTIALSCCKRLTTTGAATSTPKYSYMYANVVRILNAFDSLYMKLSSLPPAQPGMATSPASYHYQFPESQAILSHETACNVYLKFLETAKVLAAQDPQVAKQALRRATSAPEEEEATGGKKPSPPKKVDDKFLALPPHLPTLLSSSRTPPPHAIALAEKLLRLAMDTLKEPRAKWGHGEREALSRNTEMLKALLGKKTLGSNFSEENILKRRSFASSRTAQPEAWNAWYLRAKQREAMGGGEGVEIEEDSAAAWQPDSARDRGKKRMDAWGMRVKSGVIGEARRLKHHKPNFEEVREMARSDFRRDRESRQVGGGYNSRLRRDWSEGEWDRDKGDKGVGRNISKREGGYGSFEQERGGERDGRYYGRFELEQVGDPGRGHGDRELEKKPNGGYTDKPPRSINRDTLYTSPPDLDRPGERDDSRFSRDRHPTTPPSDSPSPSRLKFSINRVWDGSGAPPDERAGSGSPHCRDEALPPSPAKDPRLGQVTAEERLISRESRGDDKLWQAYAIQQQQQKARELPERGRGTRGLRGGGKGGRGRG
ncbi:hypothetical protein EV426DRAFT_369923 [Tirmania nivea]|nr:hypothetical protein EV426DRAFT_369923 [Tirmania nivea]